VLNYSQDQPLTKAEADEFDTAVFEYKAELEQGNKHRNSLASSNNSTVIASSWKNERRISTISTLSHRSSIKSTKFAPIEESPQLRVEELPDESKERLLSPALSLAALSTSPSQSSIRSNQSNRSTTTAKSNDPKGRPSGSRSYLRPSWLFSAFKSTPSQAQTTAEIVHAESSPKPSRASSSRNAPSAQPTSRRSSKPAQSQGSDSKPVGIKRNGQPRPTFSRMVEDNAHNSQRIVTPLGTPPRDEVTFGKRRGTLSSLTAPLTSSSPVIRTNPCRAMVPLSYSVYSLARRWEHMSPQPWFKYDIKWISMTTPGCLPLTVEHFPTISELESSYDVSSYDFVVDPPDMRSFLVKPPYATGPDVRHAWALAIIRGMAAVRLSQGFQFVLGPKKTAEKPEKSALRRTSSFMGDDEMTPKPTGAAEVLRSAEPVYLSMSNEIHRISYAAETIQVRRYVRRMPPSPPFKYECLIWPKLGVGYTEWKTSFASHGLENYGWNRQVSQPSL
jgi:DEP domain-containing protein 5